MGRERQSTQRTAAPEPREMWCVCMAHHAPCESMYVMVLDSYVLSIYPGGRGTWYYRYMGYLSFGVSL